MKNTFFLFFIIILLGINLKAYRDFKDTNAMVKKYSSISIVLCIVVIIMSVLLKFF